MSDDGGELAMRRSVFLCVATLAPFCASWGATCSNTAIGSTGIICVQSKSCVKTAGTGYSTTNPCSFNSTPTPTNTILVASDTYNTTQVLDDNQGNGTYTTDAAQSSGGASNLYRTAINRASNIASTGTFTVMQTLGAASYSVVRIYEFSGLPTTSPVDGIAQAAFGPITQAVLVATDAVTSTGTARTVPAFESSYIGKGPTIGGTTCANVSAVADATHLTMANGTCPQGTTTFTLGSYATVAVGPIVTTQTNDLIFVSVAGGAVSLTWTVGSGYTLGETNVTTASTTITATDEFAPAATATSYVASLDFSVANSDAAMVMVAYKSSGGGGGGAVVRRRLIGQ